MWPKPHHSNNLIGKYTTFVKAEGQNIYIKGKVLDGNCVPVAGAKVVIYQADNKGKYQFNNKSVFNGSWYMFTDNEGNFHFTTISPGARDGLTSNIIFRINHPDFDEFETRIFFPHFDNWPIIKKLNPSVGFNMVHMLEFREGKVAKDVIGYSIELTMKQTNSYKEF